MLYRNHGGALDARLDVPFSEDGDKVKNLIRSHPTAKLTLRLTARHRHRQFSIPPSFLFRHFGRLHSLFAPSSGLQDSDDSDTIILPNTSYTLA
jgi:hypothetical protein